MKAKIQSRIFLILFVINAFITFVISALFVYQQYFSADARYARDNLEFLTQQIHGYFETIPAQHTHGISAIKYPEAIAVKQIRQYSNLWSDSYISAILEAEHTEVIEELPGNPFDTLSRMVLTANDTYIQDIYTEVQLNAALTNPDTLELLISSTSNVRLGSETYIKASENAMLRIANELMACIIIVLFFLLASCFWLYLYLRTIGKLPHNTLFNPNISL